MLLKYGLCTCWSICSECASGVSVHVLLRACERDTNRAAALDTAACLCVKHLQIPALLNVSSPLPSVPPTGNFKEVSPRPLPWHLQLLLSFHPLVPNMGSNSCHLFSTKIIQIEQLQLGQQTFDLKKESLTS